MWGLRYISVAMAHPKYKKRRRRPAARTSVGGETTRQNILEVAGQVFAEHGFDGTTGKEICERAGANSAAVNYYFGGIEGLYAAVILEAKSRLCTIDTLAAVAADDASPEDKLRRLGGLFVGAITSPTTSSWMLRVLGREMVAPSPALDAVRAEEMPLRTKIIRAIVGGVMKLPPEHPVVGRACVTLMGTWAWLLIGDRRILGQAFPDVGFTPDDAPNLTRHIVQFALAGLAAIAEDAKREARSDDQAGNAGAA